MLLLMMMTSATTEKASGPKRAVACRRERMQLRTSEAKCDMLCQDQSDLCHAILYHAHLFAFLTLILNWPQHISSTLSPSINIFRMKWYGLDSRVCCGCLANMIIKFGSHKRQTLFLSNSVTTSLPTELFIQLSQPPLRVNSPFP